jgi:hypothetical protein
MQKAVPSPTDAEHPGSHLLGSPDYGFDAGIQSWDIAAAGEYTDGPSHLFSFRSEDSNMNLL